MHTNSHTWINFPLIIHGGLINYTNYNTNIADLCLKLNIFYNRDGLYERQLFLSTLNAKI